MLCQQKNVEVCDANNKPATIGYIYIFLKLSARLRNMLHILASFRAILFLTLALIVADPSGRFSTKKNDGE